MSILDDIKARVRQGRLVEFEPVPPSSKYRLVFLLPAVAAQISDPWEEGSDDAVQMPYVRADLENFVAGGPVVTAFGRGPNANFRRLQAKSKKQARAWEVRTMEPPPGYRLLGFFADTDIFVGVELVPRDLVNFHDDIERALATWRDLLGTCAPVVSENIHEYISENVVRLR